MNASMRILIKIMLIILLKFFDTTEAPSNFTPQNKEISTAMLTEIATPLHTIGNTLFYGNLVIELPIGMTAEKKDATLDNQRATDVIDLKGMKEEAPLAPRLWITHYRAQYTDEGKMIRALLERMPDTTLRLRYRDFDEKRYLFTYSSEDKMGYIIVCGNDVYFVEELLYLGKAIFGELLDNHSVRWGYGFWNVGDRKNKDNIVWFDRIQLGNDFFLVLRYTEEDGRRWIKLLCDTEPNNVWQEIEIDSIETIRDEWIIYRDYNFDGYFDINVSSKVIYLWNPVKKQYEAAQIPEEFMQLRDRAYFPETEIIWGYDYDTVNLKNWMDIDECETLWKWTGNTLMKERACNAQVRGKTVRICISDGSSDNAMFECNVALEEYREGSEKVQLFYKKFYENMVPPETFRYVHWMKYDREDIVYIPQEFLDFVVDAMLNGTEVKNLKPMLNDRELSEEEILSIAENNIDLRQTVIDKTWTNPYLMVMADGDNDGIPDIIARESSGGSDGSVAFVFYKGQEDGTFRQTDIFSAMREEFGIVSYKGKNYLLRTLFDYNKKIYNGLSITYYMEGKRVEQAVLMLVPKNYKTILTECVQEKYQSYAEQIAIKSLLYKIWLEEENSITGNSEQKLADYGMYQCDLNNDGVMDTYQKELWEPSNINICEYLYFDGDGEAIAPVKEMLDSLDKTPIMMWVDLVQDKNIINVISQTGLEEFTITGFLVQDFEYERLYKICVDVTYAIDIWKEVP